MSRYPSGYLQIPSLDGPSDTRSQGSHQSGGGSQSHSRRTSQVSGSHVSASHPGSQAPGSAPPSNVGAPSGPVGSRPSSNVGGRSPPRGYPEPLGYDPAREPKTFGEDFNKNIDLPPEAYVEVGRPLQNKSFLHYSLTISTGPAHDPLRQAPQFGQCRQEDQCPGQPVPRYRNACPRHYPVRRRYQQTLHLPVSSLIVCNRSASAHRISSCGPHS